MRTIAASETHLAWMVSRTVHTRVVISCIRGASWSVTLTSLESRDWLLSCEVTQATDEAMGTCTMHLARNAFELSLAPLVKSKLNRVNGAATVLLQPRRVIEVSTQITPLGEASNPNGTWTSIFMGEIYDVDPGSGDDPTITLQCLDEGAILKRFFNRKEQPPKNANVNPSWYTLGVTFPVALETLVQATIDGCITNSHLAWVTATAYTIGDIRRPTTANRNGFCYRCTTGGTTAGAEPTWPTYVGGTVVDGTVTWTCHYDQLPTLYTPVVTGINVDAPTGGSPLVTQTDLDAMVRTWVMASGFDLRMRYIESAPAGWRLTLATPTGDVGPTFTPSQYRVTGFRYSDADVRNVIGVPWTNKAAGDAFTLTAYEDTTSRIQYGTQYFQLAEEECYAIDTQAEADALGVQLLADLAWPVATITIVVPYYPWLEVGDMNVTLIGAGSFSHPLWTSDIENAVCVGVKHSLTDGQSTTELTFTVAVGGTDPRVFVTYWLDRDPRVTGTTMGAYGKTEGAALTTVPAKCVVDAHAASTQSIATDVWTILNIDTIDRDLGGDFSVGAYKFTAPMTGRYDVAASMEIGGTVAGDNLGVGISANASAFACQGNLIAAAGKTGALQVTCTGTVDLTAGNSLRVYGFHNHGSNLTVAAGVMTRFSARRIV